MAQYAAIPVINGLTDYSHPCQAMADYLTMLEIRETLEGLKLTFVGDGNNVAHSLMFAGAQLEPTCGSRRRRLRAKDGGDGMGTPARRVKRAELHDHATIRCRPLRRRRGLHRCVGQHGAGSGSREERRKIFHAVPGERTLSARRSETPSSCIVCRRIAETK